LAPKRNVYETTRVAEGKPLQQFDEFAREQAILLDLESVGRVMVNELTERFGVSAVTVRKDLDALERRSLLRRIRGGAVSAGNSDEGAWGMRLRHSQAAKQAIAKSVAPLVADGDVIALDSSTTSYYLAQELLDRRNLVVITNGLRTASLLMVESTSMVVLPAGCCGARRSPWSDRWVICSPAADPSARASSGWSACRPSSACSRPVSRRRRRSPSSRPPATRCSACSTPPRPLASACIPSSLLADITALYTDDGIPDDVVAAWANAGVTVKVAPAGAAVHRLREGSA
jgi:DeoR/GlpR family transcriptional regulator of sugar metabolism